MQHLKTLFDLSTSAIQTIFSVAEDLKTKYESGIREPLLPGRVMAMVFEKPSLRTRASFEAAMAHLGGTSMLLGPEAGMGKRESLADFVKVLSGYVDVIAMRVFAQQTIDEAAAYSHCSVINALSDVDHPCQALGDLFTLRELQGGNPEGTLAFIGDGNNVARSLAVACARLGVRFAIATPESYELPYEFVSHLQSEIPGAEIFMTHEPAEAVAHAQCVYTDVWASMGQEKEKQKRSADFDGFSVDAKLMSQASKGAWFMHCLPANRGAEVTDEVLDGKTSVVLRQAQNRMHIQKGILAWLLGSKS